MNRMISAILKSVYCFAKEDYFYRASALAFATTLAIVPLFAVIVFFITFFPIFSDVILLSQNYLLENFIPSAAFSIQGYFTIFVKHATTMPIGSILFLLLTAFMLINTVQKTLNVVWQTKKHRRTLSTILFYWLVILLTPLIIGGGIFISTEFFKLFWVTKITQVLQLKILIDILLPIITNTIIFTLLYVITPSAPVKWRYGLLGGFLAALLFNFTRISFVWYLVQFKSYSIVYGVFAVIPIFMLWLYIAWIIIIWGALFSYHLQIQEK